MICGRTKSPPPASSVLRKPLEPADLHANLDRLIATSFASTSVGSRIGMNSSDPKA